MRVKNCKIKEILNNFKKIIKFSRLDMKTQKVNGKKLT